MEQTIGLVFAYWPPQTPSCSASGKPPQDATQVIVIVVGRLPKGEDNSP